MHRSLQSFLMRSVPLLLLICLPLAHAQPADLDASDDPLLAGFLDPPKEARPSAYWLWLNGYVNRDHVEQELRAYRDAGIRGLCIFDMGARGAAEGQPPAGPAFMSDESVGDIAHAVRIAGELGMDVQLSVASSWDMGGAWVEPRHASMGLFMVETTIEGPRDFADPLPVPPIPEKAPRAPDGSPAFSKDIVVLAIPGGQRRPGHEFVFRLPPGIHTLDHALLHNADSGDAARYGHLHLFTKDFSIAVSDTGPEDNAFREVLRGTLAPHTDAQRFPLGGVQAQYVRLRLLNGHNTAFDRIQLAEFAVYDDTGRNIVASHEVDRTQDGAELLGNRSALGHDKNWTADNIHDGSTAGAAGSWSSAGPPPLVIQEPASIIDLTRQIDAEGRLHWSVPDGPWVVQRYVCLNTGETLKVPSPNSDGLATDHFSAEATREFLGYLIARLQSALGDLGQTALKQLYLASYEVRGPISTPNMLAEFAQRRGYEMTPYLPALFGAQVVDDEVTQRFLYDYRKTLGDLLVDAYYGAAVESAHAAGLGIESEAGGPGPPIHNVPVDALKALGRIDEVRGEFWPKRPDADRLWVVKETACAAHVYGKRRVHMEAFTSMHHWQDGPFDLKPSADRAFCEGMNHAVWHTGAHQPPEAGQPGWVYGAGTHLNTNLVWWSQARAFLDYLARCSYMLQQGRFVADVCYYYGDQGYNFVPPKQADPSLGYGYDYDVIDREALLSRMSVQEGRLVLPDGMGYALLVLPDREDIDLDVLKKIEELVQAGATIVGPKPMRSNGLTGYPERDSEVREIAARIWGNCDGTEVFEHTFGKGRVVWGRALREVLRERGIGPDFRFESPDEDARIDFIHRHTPEAELYFVSNSQYRWERIDGVFRVFDHGVELWDPATGVVRKQHVHARGPQDTTVPLELAPHGSILVVFRKQEPLPPLVLEQPEAARGLKSTLVEAWDGERAELTLFQAGQYRLRSNAVSVAYASAEIPAPLHLDGPWNLRFQTPDGAVEESRFPSLIPWNEHENETMRYFSGAADYEYTFDLNGEWATAEHRLVLDLGDLWAVGQVWLNGHPLGIVWKLPYAVEITDAAQAGRNRLVVRVANTWSNRLVGDARLPEDERRTRTNVTSTNGVAWKNAPLLKSGLFGPVRILCGKRVSLALR